MSAPRSVGRGGGTLGFWQSDRILEAAAGAAALVSRPCPPPRPPPPPMATENSNKNMTIRRIYNEVIYFFEISVCSKPTNYNIYTILGGPTGGCTFRIGYKGKRDHSRGVTRLTMHRPASTPAQKSGTILPLPIGRPQ